MKRSFGAGIAPALALAACVLSRCATSSAPAPEPAAAPLEAVIGAIQEALSEAVAAESPSFPALKSVTVKVQTAAVRSVSGKIDVVVFSAGAGVESEEASTLELKLTPPPSPGKTVAPAAIKTELARAIHLAQAAAARAARGTPPLALSKAELELKFAVETQGSAGAEVTLVPVGLQAGGKLKKNAIHTIGLVFGD